MHILCGLNSRTFCRTFTKQEKQFLSFLENDFTETITQVEEKCWLIMAQLVLIFPLIITHISLILAEEPPRLTPGIEPCEMMAHNRPFFGTSELVEAKILEDGFEDIESKIDQVIILSPNYFDDLLSFLCIGLSPRPRS